jgi:hypothetical protein
LVDWLIVWLLGYWLHGCMVAWLVRCLVGWSVGRSIGCLLSQLNIPAMLGVSRSGYRI